MSDTDEIMKLLQHNDLGETVTYEGKVEAPDVAYLLFTKTKVYGSMFYSAHKTLQSAQMSPPRTLEWEEDLLAERWSSHAGNSAVELWTILKVSIRD